MKIVTYILAGAFLFFGSSCFLFGSNPNQQKNQKKLQINAGYYNLGSVDKIYSNNLYTGHSICYGLKYNYGKGPAREFTSLRYAMVDRTPAPSIANNTLFAADSRERILKSFLFEAIYSYQYPIDLHMGDNLSFYFTGDWITTVNITTNSYGVPELARSGLSPGAMLEATIRRHIFSGRFSIPVVSWSVRNNYSQSMAQNYESLDKFAFVKQNDKLQFPNTLMEVDAVIEYTFNLSKRFNIGCEYDFRYMYNSSPRKLESVTGIYTAGLTYKF
jgi:hypothetical protein